MSQSPPAQLPPAASSAAPPRVAAAQTFDSKLLFRDAREVLIRHNGEFYRLRLTRAGKLILTK